MKNKSQKKIDDFYALIFARPISQRISSLIFKTKITPNQISIFGTFLALISGALILLNKPIIAAVILYASFIADCVDGEIARLKKQFTKFGLWLESSFDALSLLIPLLAIGILTKNWIMALLSIMFFLLTRVRMLASDMISLKYNKNTKEELTSKKHLKIMWQLRYGNSLQFLIIIIALLFSLYNAIFYLTIILAGGYYLLTIIYEFNHYRKDNVKNKKIVITYGTYDLLHLGHVNILRRAKAKGDFLIIGLSTDKFNKIKNKKSFFDYETREKILESIKYVDKVIPENSWGQKESDIKKYKVDTFVMGDDWKNKFNNLESLCEVIYLPRTKKISTTKIKTLFKTK